MSELAYLNFDLQIERAEHSEPGRPDYRVRVLASPAGATRPVSFRVPFSDLEVENFLLKIGSPRRNFRAMKTPQVTEIKNFGGRLFEAVFTAELHENLAASLNRADASDAGLRIRLRFCDCPELSELPWEYLYDREHNRFLCLSERTPLVRYVEVPDPVHVVPVTPPLRILVVIASPSDLQLLDGEKEWSNVTAALGELTQWGLVEVVRLEEATLGALHRQLRRDTYHIFHFIGHGGFDPHTQAGTLAMEDEHGRSRMVGEELGTLLHDHQSLRLAVLKSCAGARGGRSDPFSGTAQSLIQQGIPAVVAMQFEITDEAAITFSHVLYEAIADGYPLDVATAEARKAIYADGNLTEWGTPVLYSSAPDGRIFDIQDRPTYSYEPPARREAEEQAQREAEEKPQREAEERARQKAEEQAPRAPVAPAVLHGRPMFRSRSSGQVFWVDLWWDPPVEGSVDVVAWEVRRDGIRVREVTEPRAMDQPPGRGPYTYTVTAVGVDGQRSAESNAWVRPEIPWELGRVAERPLSPGERRSDVLPPVVDENVQFTVYRPGAVQPGVWYPMLTFAHLAERRDQVTALADQALGDKARAYGSPTSDARGGVPKASELTFVPDMVGVEFNPPRRVFRWLEDIHREEFRLRADPRLNGQVSHGRLTVFLGAFILADVDLAIRIDDSAEEPPTASILTSAAAQGPSPGLHGVLEPTHGSPYRSIFPSYSHRDTEIVNQAERLGAALGDVYLRDRTTLHSGEEWNAGLLKLIDKADVFQLFWSSNSMRSEYVRQEWEHAVTLARPNFIRPTYWEEPMPRSDHPLLPPSSLGRLHFQLLVLPRRHSRASLVVLVSVLVSVCILIVLLWSR